MGKIIVFEGIDFSGKATQLQLLKRRLTSSGHRVACFDFPQYHTPPGKKIAEYLSGKTALRDPYRISRLYADDRKAAADSIRNANASADLVLINRYVSSNTAFQGARLSGEEKRKFQEWITALEYHENGLPKEDLVIVLDVSPERSAPLAAGKGDRGYIAQGEKDINECDASYQHAVRGEYHNLAQQQGWVVITCEEDGKLLPADAIAARVFQAIQGMPGFLSPLLR